MNFTKKTLFGETKPRKGVSYRKSKSEYKQTIDRSRDKSRIEKILFCCTIVGSRVHSRIEEKKKRKKKEKQNGQPLSVEPGGEPSVFRGTESREEGQRRGWMSGRKRKRRNVSKGGCPWQCSCGIKDPRRVLDPDVTTLHTLVTRYCEILLSRGSSCKRIRAIGNAKRLCRDYSPVVNSNFPVCTSTFGENRHRWKMNWGKGEEGGGRGRPKTHFCLFSHFEKFTSGTSEISSHEKITWKISKLLPLLHSRFFETNLSNSIRFFPSREG